MLLSKGEVVYDLLVHVIEWVCNSTIEWLKYCMNMKHCGPPYMSRNCFPLVEKVYSHANIWRCIAHKKNFSNLSRFKNFETYLVWHILILINTCDKYPRYMHFNVFFFRTTNTKVDLGKFANLKEIEKLRLRGVCGLVLPAFSFSGGLAELSSLTTLRTLVSLYFHLMLWRLPPKLKRIHFNHGSFLTCNELNRFCC